MAENVPSPSEPYHAWMNDDATFLNIENAAHSGAFGMNGQAAPSDAQCAAGNYRKGRVTLYGLALAIEQPRNSYRTGVDAKTGKRWVSRVAAHYGYICGTKGNDGDEVDCFIGPYPQSDRAYVINQNIGGRFDEVKVMLAFPDEASARRAYLDSYDRNWRGLASLVPVSIPQLKWWLKHGNMRRALRPDDLPHEGLEAMTRKVYWNSDAQPHDGTLDHILYDIRRSDAGENLLMDAVTAHDIMEDSDGELSLDALVSPYARLERRMEILRGIMERTGDKVKPVAMQVTQPFKQRGVANVAAIFELSDGQTVSIYFHNPDTTPGKMAPTDEVISWKWLLNKKDITIVVAPERGADLNVREVARRIMRLAEKNSAAFQRANAKRTERMQTIADLKTEITQLEGELKSAQNELEVAKLEWEEAQERAKSQPVPDDQVDYTKILTPGVLKHLRDSVLAAKYEGNDKTYIESDRITAEFGNTLTPQQYKNYDMGKAEDLLFNKLHEIERDLGLGQEKPQSQSEDEQAQGKENITSLTNEEAKLRETPESLLKADADATERLPETEEANDEFTIGTVKFQAFPVENWIGKRLWAVRVQENGKEINPANGINSWPDGDVKEDVIAYLTRKHAAVIQQRGQVEGENEWRAVFDLAPLAEQSREEENPAQAKSETAGQDTQETQEFTAPTKPYDEYLNEANGNGFEAAKAFYKTELQGKIVKTVIGDVHLLGSSWHKIRGDARKDDLMSKLVPHVPDILKTGKYEGKESLYKERADDYVAFHHFIKEVEIDSRIVTAGVGVGERVDGQFEYVAYSLNHSLNKSWKKRKAPGHHVLDMGREPSGASASADEKIETQNLDSVNSQNNGTSSNVLDVPLSREEVFRGLGVPSEPTTKPRSTSSPLLTMDASITEEEDGWNIRILKVVDTKTGERLRELEDGGWEDEAESGETPLGLAANPDAEAIATGTETGAFGEIFHGYTNQPEAAIDKIMAEKRGEVPDAFVHPELGNIAFVYGDERMGLRHIEVKHPEMLARIPEVLRTGRLVRDAKGLPRSYIVQDGEPSKVATIRLDWDGEQKTWLVTAFTDDAGKFKAQKSPDEPSKVISERPTHPTTPFLGSPAVAGQENYATNQGGGGDKTSSTVTNELEPVQSNPSRPNPQGDDNAKESPDAPSGAIPEQSVSPEKAASEGELTRARTLFQNIIDGTVPDILAPELADEMEAAYLPVQGDPEIEALFVRAVDAYQAAMLAATENLE